jgi:zinc protease
MKHTGDANYYTLRLFDFLLGGDSFNSYLTQKIRTEKGWAYSAYSSFETDDFTGSIMLFTQTANMNLPEVIAAIDDILAKPEDFISKDTNHAGETLSQEQVCVSCLKTRCNT